MKRYLEVRILPKPASTLALFILSALVLLAFTGAAFGDNAHFTVEPLKTHSITLSLHETDSVSGSFSVVSNDETGVDFVVTDPYNNTIMQYDNVLQKSFSFTADTDGNYQLHFDNSVSDVNSKTVSLNYNITSYIMGMPQEQFLLLIVAAAAVIGLILYAVLMPK